MILEQHGLENPVSNGLVHGSPPAQNENGVAASSPQLSSPLIPSPPAAFRSFPGELDDDLIVNLYGTLSRSANRSVRRRGSLLSSPAVPESPVATARHVSRRNGRSSVSRDASSSLSRPPGFSSTALSTPVYNAASRHSPVSVLRLQDADALEDDEDRSADLGGLLVEGNRDAEPDEVNAMMEGNNGNQALANMEGYVMNQVADDEHNVEQNALPFPAFGLHLFAGLEDEELLQLVRNSGFVVPDDIDCQEDILSRLRQLDEP